MRRGRVFIYLALILIVGLVAVFLLFSRLRSLATPEATPTPALVEVLIAGQNISQGEPVTKEALETIWLPEDKVVEVMFRKDQEDQVIGKLARYPITQGVVITRPMLAETAAELMPPVPEWVRLIPPGMTAIAIPTSRLAAVAYGVADGVHVNVVACLLFVDVDPAFQTSLPNYTALVTGSGYMPEQLPVLSAGVNSGGIPSTQGRVELDPTLQQPFYVVPSEQQRPRLACQMVFQNVSVLRLGGFPLEAAKRQPAQTTPSPAVQEQQQAEQAAPQPPDIVTLIVSPQDAVTLTYLIYSGAKLTLTLRGIDDQRMETEAATLQYVLSQYAIPVPAKLPYAAHPRTDELVQPFMPNDITVTIPPE